MIPPNGPDCGDPCVSTTCTTSLTGPCSGILTLAEACGDPAFVVDESYTLVFWNAAAEAAFDVTASEAVGRPCFEVIAGHAASGQRVCQTRCEKWAIARRGARVHNFDIRALPHRAVWLNVSILPVRDIAGRVVALMHVARNVNQAKRLERYVRDLASSSAGLLAGEQASAASEPDPVPVRLTQRELQILRLVAHGRDTASIAEELGISQYTARNHVTSVLEKLGVHSRVEATAYAYKHRLA